MKKIAIIMSLILFSFLINVPNVLAFDSGIRNADDTELIVEDGDISFKEFHFDIYQYGQNEHQIGFMGIITNKSLDDKNLNITIKFYDSNQNLIASDYKRIDLYKDSTIYYNLHSTDTELGCNYEDIKYYSFSFTQNINTTKDDNYNYKQDTYDNNKHENNNNNSNLIDFNSNMIYDDYIEIGFIIAIILGYLIFKDKRR